MQDVIPESLYKRYLDKEMAKIAQALAHCRFWWVMAPNENTSMLFDRDTLLLWESIPDTSIRADVESAECLVEDKEIMGLTQWRLPRRAELTSFASASGNPLQSGAQSRLLRVAMWLCDERVIDLENNNWEEEISHQEGACIACNDYAANLTLVSFITEAKQKGWRIEANNGDEDLLANLDLSTTMQALYEAIDYRSCRLPMLEQSQFTDPDKGLWEFWGMPSELLAAEKLRARNPANDIRDWNIAIDFGTSSTVVAYDDNGRHKLLRIGVKDHWEREQPAHYENPTALEFIDFQAFMGQWHSESYRPNLSWDEVRCSHEALQNLRNNGSNPSTVASILTRLKQWALRQEKDARVRLIDISRQHEHELEPQRLRNPVKGERLRVGKEDPFDPVELYAWFLGMTINWRQRGLFLRYYLTFPVAYPRAVKDNILAAFRRGLQRSLPASLIMQDAFLSFSVEELANEPAAYAAAVLPRLGLEPSVEGAAYAVFDFGGGTTDFDFGYYRAPNAEEENDGWEEVIAHCGNGGDRFLGGENLLENMAYQVFQHNLELCRKHKIAFTQPLDADDFPGSEMFLEKTQSALTNSLMVISRLRPLWENGKLPESDGVLKIGLLNRTGESKNCELAVPVDALQAYLCQRIELGLINFFSAMRKVFNQQVPGQIHVLLAGNSSRSHIVRAFFNRSLESAEQDEKTQSIDQNVSQGVMPSSVEQELANRRDTLIRRIFGNCTPDIVVHFPMGNDSEDIYAPSAKTGVALGLLRLAPGGPIKVIQTASDERVANEAPFAHYVGRLRQGRFQPGLNQGDRYGAWQEIGVPRDGVFNLYHSQSPKAFQGEMLDGDPGLYKKRLDLGGNLQGQRVFACAVAPNLIRVCTAVSTEAASSNEHDNLREVELA
ncbi:hypothetical protein ACNFBT_12305 [Pseudomonas sp. NY15181]|uniref:hypothetical protein n=1 Tax=Pseudomonas sp. NY15181 TaxID=3400349 RepID=UPI003A85D28C